MNKFGNNSDYSLDMSKKRTFKEIYDAIKNLPTPFDSFVAELSKVVGRDAKTLRMWYYGVQRPPKKIMPLIEEYFGIDADTLFPPKPNTSK